MASAVPFFSPEKCVGFRTCYACRKSIDKSEKESTILKDGITSFETQAKQWEKIPIPPELPEHNFTLVASIFQYIRRTRNSCYYNSVSIKSPEKKKKLWKY